MFKKVFQKAKDYLITTFTSIIYCFIIFLMYVGVIMIIALICIPYLIYLVGKLLFDVFSDE